MRITLEVASVGQALAAERAVAGQRAYVVAARAGIHPTTLAKIEKGERACSMELAARVRAAIAAGRPQPHRTQHQGQCALEGVAS